MESAGAISWLLSHNANVQPRHCGNNTRHTHAASDDTPCYDLLNEVRQ